MFHFLPKILFRALNRIPDANSINRQAVFSYLQQVIGRGRAHVLDEDGIRLTLGPHLEQPYTDSEWKTSLQKQQEVASIVADILLRECPNLMAVTLYGPLARRTQNFLMFHPQTGLSLGAFFYQKDRDQISRALELSQELGERYGISIRPGTAHGGVFGGLFYTWGFSTPQDAREFLNKLESKEGSSMVDLYVNHLAEITVQVLDGIPLAVRNEKDFMKFLAPVKKFKAQYFGPIFNRVKFLFEHFERGYPYPVEYKGRFR